MPAPAIKMSSFSANITVKQTLKEALKKEWVAQQIFTGRLPSHSR